MGQSPTVVQYILIQQYVTVWDSSLGGTMHIHITGWDSVGQPPMVVQNLPIQ